MIAALLHGRTHLNFQEFRQQNHLTFFLHVLGVLELLQPQVFQSEHQGALCVGGGTNKQRKFILAGERRPLAAQLMVGKQHRLCEQTAAGELSQDASLAHEMPCE